MNILIKISEYKWTYARINHKKYGANILRSLFCATTHIGSVYSIQIYKNDEKNGSYVRYDPNGMVCQLGYRVSGDFHGFVLSFDNRRLTCIKEMNHGLLDGYIIQFEPSGIISTESLFRMGLRIGVDKKYNTHGYLTSVCMYRMNTRNGLNIEFLNSTKLLKSICYMVDGYKNGQFYKFYRNGLLHNVQYLKKNTYHGPYTLYDRNGKLVSSDFYDNSVCVSEEIRDLCPWDDNKLEVILRTGVVW